MINLYCTLIINKRKKFDEVHASLQGAVETRLRELGYDTNGDKLVSEEA